MDHFARWPAPILQQKLRDPYVHVLFGARQTGKSTLLRSLLPADALTIDLADPGERRRFSAAPEELIGICRAMPRGESPSWVFIDEAQSVPAIFDSIQVLYDSERERWRFVLCGSSARKLRTQGTNLLPGRSVLHHLHPLTSPEYERRPDRQSWGRTAPAFRLESPCPPSSLPTIGESPAFPPRSLEDRLVFGDLPGVALAGRDDLKSDLLETYASAYIEEEIRREASLRDWGSFVRFMRFAAREAGGILNFSSISRETGISIPTIKNYYQLLEDMFVGFTVPAYSGSPRKSVLSTPRFLFFDTGVRNAAADFPLRLELTETIGGQLLEQWVGAELHRRIAYRGSGGLTYFRTKDGAEIDYVVEFEGKVHPIEVKWSDRPSPKDARHLDPFLDELGERAGQGYLICRCPRPVAISERITALPWEMM